MIYHKPVKSRSLRFHSSFKLSPPSPKKHACMYFAAHLLAAPYLIDKAQTPPYLGLIKQNCLHHHIVKPERRASWELCNTVVSSRTR